MDIALMSSLSQSLSNLFEYLFANFSLFMNLVLLSNRLAVLVLLVLRGSRSEDVSRLEAFERKCCKGEILLASELLCIDGETTVMFPGRNSITL